MIRDIELQLMHFRWFMRDVHTVEDFIELCELADGINQ
jgi:hypothetical protein